VHNTYVRSIEAGRTITEWKAEMVDWQGRNEERRNERKEEGNDIDKE